MKKTTTTTTKATETKRARLTEEQKKAREQEKEQKREQARLEYDGGHLYIVASRKNSKGEKIECKDNLHGRYQHNAITMGTDKYNTTVITKDAKGMCWIDVITSTKDTSRAYDRNSKFADLIKAESKQTTIQALRNLPFATVMSIVVKSKDFTEGITKQAMPIVEDCLARQAQRTATAKATA